MAMVRIWFVHNSKEIILKRIVLIAVLMLSPCKARKAFLIDLSGVVVQPWPLGRVKAYDKVALLSHIFLDLKIPSKERVFEFMDKLDFHAPEDFIKSKDTSNTDVPLPICLYQAGMVTAHEILAKAQEVPDNFFVSRREKRVLLNALAIAVDSEIHASIMKLIPETVQILRTLKEEHHELYLLSNWDADSIALLKTRFPDVFGLFDGIVLACHVGRLKPHKNMYTYALNTYNLQAEDCLYIEDQQECIAAL